MKPNNAIAFETLRTSLDQLADKELLVLKEAIDLRLRKNIDNENEYVEEARKRIDRTISLASVRAALSKIPGSISEVVISERKDRF